MEHVLTGVIACGFMLTLLALIVPASLSVFVDDVLEKPRSAGADWWQPCMGGGASWYTSCPFSGTGS